MSNSTLKDTTIWNGLGRPLNDADHTWQVAWIDACSGDVKALHGLQLPPDATPAPELYWELLQQAVSEPLQGESGRPQILAVEDQALAEFLSQKTADWQVEITVEVDEFMGEALETTARRFVTSAGYLSRSDADLEELRRFFAATKRWAEQEPWMALSDTEMIMIKGLSEPLVACVIGASDSEQGLALFSSPDQVMQFMEQPESVRMFFQYCDAATAGPAVVAEINSHQLPILNDEMIPVASAPGQSEPFASPHDLRLLRECMDIVDVYLEQEINLEEDVLTHEIELPSGQRVTVTSLRYEEAPPEH